MRGSAQVVDHTDQCVTEQCGAEYHLHTVVVKMGVCPFSYTLRGIEMRSVGMPFLKYLVWLCACKSIPDFSISFPSVL